MNTFLLILLGLASIVLIASILLQSGNSAGLSGSIGGGAEQLFGKKRARKYDAVLNKVTTVAGILFIVLSLVLVAMELLYILNCFKFFINLICAFFYKRYRSVRISIVRCLL